MDFETWCAALEAQAHIEDVPYDWLQRAYAAGMTPPMAAKEVREGRFATESSLMGPRPAYSGAIRVSAMILIALSVIGIVATTVSMISYFLRLPFVPGQARINAAMGIEAVTAPTSLYVLPAIGLLGGVFGLAYADGVRARELGREESYGR